VVGIAAVVLAFGEQRLGREPTWKTMTLPACEYGNSQADITRTHTNNMLLMTRDEGKITLSGIEQEGDLTPKAEGGAIEFLDKPVIAPSSQPATKVTSEPSSKRSK